MAKRKPSKTVVVDLDRCLACRSCETACAKAHAGFSDMVEAVLSGARLVPRVRVITVAGKAVPIQCQHCEDAPCATVCPSGAIFLDEEQGTVVADQEKCTGCKACVRVCPFGAIEWDPELGALVMCDVCENLMEEGGQPHCVAACPTRAMRLVEVAERRYPPGACRALISYEIDPKICICCGRCAKDCPVQCISGKAGKPPAKAKKKDRDAGKVGEPFKIDKNICIRCGICFDVCPVNAVSKT